MKQLLSQNELKDGVARVAGEVAACYGQRPLTIIGILTGSVVLLADLIRLLDMPLRVGVLQARSYQGATTTRGQLSVNHDLMPDIASRDVLLVDDIFDTGHTLAQVIDRINLFSPRSVRTLVLLYKEGRQEVELTPDFIGFRIPDKFVVGYGLDYEDLYRNLPYLAALEDDDLNSA